MCVKKVIAIEKDASLANLLLKNLKAKKIKNFEINQRGLYS
jgi:predicted RNA methylase